jgi:7tm Odorant receptor.
VPRILGPQAVAWIVIALRCSRICIVIFQGERVRDAAWSCDWVGTPVEFQRSIIFIIAMADKVFTLTAGKFVPVSKETMMNVIISFI